MTRTMRATAQDKDAAQLMGIDINTTIANYIAAWNETDSDRRRAVIARTWTDGGHYLDGHRDSTGTTRSTG